MANPWQACSSRNASGAGGGNSANATDAQHATPVGQQNWENHTWYPSWAPPADSDAQREENRRALKKSQAFKTFHTLVAHNVHKSFSEVELMDFINGALLVATENDLEDTADVAPCVCCSIDHSNCCATLGFLTVVGASAALWLDGVECRGPRLRICRPQNYPMPKGGDPAVQLCLSITEVPFSELIGVQLCGGTSTKKHDKQQDSEGVRWYDLVPTAGKARPHDHMGDEHEMWGKARASAPKVIRRKSHYDTLAVSPSASKTEIRQAFMQRCRALHPDSQQDGSTPAEFYELTQAYRTLSFQVSREIYDEQQLCRDVFDGPLQSELRAVAFLLRHPFLPIHRMLLNRRHAQQMAAGTIQELLKSKSGGDILLPSDQQQSDTEDLVALIAGKPVSIEMAKTSILDHVAELDGLRAPKGGYVVVVPAAVRSKLPSIQENSSKIAMQTHTGLSFAEDRIILRGAQSAVCVATVQWWLDWKGRVLLPDGRTLDPWSFAYEVELTTKKWQGSLVPTPEPEMEVVWQMVASAMHQRVYTIPPATRGPFTRWATQVLEAMLKGGAVFSAVVMRAVTCRSAYEEIMASPPDHQTRLIHTLHKMQSAQFDVRTALEQFSRHPLTVAIADLRAYFQDLTKGLGCRARGFSAIREAVPQENKWQPWSDLLKPASQLVNFLTDMIGWVSGRHPDLGMVPTDWSTLPGVAASILPLCGGDSVRVDIENGVQRVPCAPTPTPPPVTLRPSEKYMRSQQSPSIPRSRPRRHFHHSRSRERTRSASRRSPSRSRKQKKSDSHRKDDSQRKDEARRKDDAHRKDDSHKRSKLPFTAEEAAQLPMCELVEEILLALETADSVWIPTGTLSKEVQYTLGPTHRGRLSKRWYEDYPASFELRAYRNGKPCSGSSSRRHEDEWRVALTSSARSRVKDKANLRKADDKRQTLLAKAEGLLNDSTQPKDVLDLQPSEVAALLITVEKTHGRDDLATACLDSLNYWGGNVAASPKKLHCAMMPFPPARVMQAVVALDQSAHEEWNESILQQLVQCAALDFHAYAEFPRATLAMVALSLKNAARQPFRAKLEAEKCLLVPAAVLRLEVELSEGCALNPTGKDFSSFAQMCAWLAHLLGQCALPAAHQKEIFRGFAKVVVACEGLDKKTGSSSYSPEGLCRLTMAIALIAREARTVVEGAVAADSSAESMSSPGFADRALESLGRCVMSQPVEQAGNWMPQQLVVLCTAISIVEIPNEALFRHVAALAKEHTRIGVEWNSAHFWKLLKAAWSLGLLQSMEMLLERAQATGSLMEHVQEAALKDLPLIFSTSVMLDSPKILQGFVGPSMQMEDLNEVSLADLVSILSTWPIADHDDRWAALHDLQAQILSSAIAFSTEPLPHAQALLLLRTAAASDRAKEHLDVLSTSKTLLNVLGTASSPVVVFSDIGHLLRPFATNGVATPRLEAACMAWLLRTMQENTSSSQHLHRLVDTIRLLDVAGALVAMPAVIAAIAQLPLVQHAVHSHDDSNNAVLHDLLRLLLSVAERAVHVREHGGDAGREDDLIDNWVLLLEAVVRDLAGEDGWNLESEDEPREWSLESVAKRAGEKLDILTAQEALGPLWLEALLVRSTRLSWSGGWGLRCVQARPARAAQAFAEKLAAVEMDVAKASTSDDAAWQPPVLVVKGTRNLGITQTVCGTYVVSGENHGRYVYSRSAPCAELEVFIYFWDDGDGDGQCGWWIGPEVGGDEVWVHHPGEPDEDRPPAHGWEILFNEAEEPQLTVIDCSPGAQSSTLLPATPTEAPSSPAWQDVRDESPDPRRHARSSSRSPRRHSEATRRVRHRSPRHRSPRRPAQLSMEEELAQLRRRAEEAEAKLAAMQEGRGPRESDLRSVLTRVATPLAPSSRVSEDAADVAEDTSAHLPPPESRGRSASSGERASGINSELPGTQAPSSSSTGETLEDAAALCKRKREESKSSREETLKAWLDGLDDGAGSMLQYYDILEAEFEADLAQIAAVKVPNYTGQGFIDAVDPIFWEIVKVSKMGHKMLLARGIAKL